MIADTLLDTSEEAFYVLDRDWRFVYLNPEAEQLIRHTRDELLGKSIWDEFPEAVGTTVHQMYHRAFAEGEPVAFEQYYVPLEMWFEVRAYPRGDLLVVHFRNIDQRKVARAALRQSEERFRLAADATSDVLWDYDFAQDRLWWNDNFSRLFGYPPEEVGTTFASWSERVHPEDRERAVAEVEEAVRAKRPRVAAEYRFRASEGTYLHVLDRMQFLYDDAGLPRRAVGVLVDITEQKAAEERQRFLVRAGAVLTSTLDYRQRLRDLARVCCGPLADCCMVDMVEEDGSIQRVEAAHAEPEQDALARKFLSFPPVGERSGGVSRALKTGEPVLVERVEDEALQQIAQSDEHLDLMRALAPRAYLVVPLRAKGRSLGAITLAITRPDRRFSEEDVQLALDLARQAALDLHNARLHRDVEHARQAAEQASHVKGQFLSMMSHELRTPLTAIIGFADLMETEVSGPMTAQQQEHVARIKASVWHLVAMIEEILTYSRMDAGAEKLRIEPTDVAGLVDQAADLLLPQAKAKGLELHREIPAEPVVIRTDPGKVRQVVINLLGNAIKFTQEGEVELALRRRDGWIELLVRDTGPGIAPEDQERIFEAFVQAEEGHTRKHGGTGLGLAISRRFAHLLGGDIEVESIPGRGSAFTFRVPAPSGLR